METCKIITLFIALSIFKSNAQTIKNDSIKLDYKKIYAFSLDGNPKAALSLLDIDTSRKVSQKDLKFKTDFENRFKFKEDKSDFLDTRKSKIDELLKIYRDYWRLSFLNKEKNNDSLIMKNVTNFLKVNFPPAKDLAMIEDSIDVYQKKYITSLGYHSTGFGKTGSLYDLLVWKTEKETIYNINYDNKKVPVKVFFLIDFIALGWFEYATLGRHYPGGWATKETLFCVRKGYDLESETFVISYLNHEGRHFADYQLFPKLKGIGSADLEYRAKLAELSLAKKTLYDLIEKFSNNANYDSENGHQIASFCVIRDLSKVLFKNDFEKDFKKWKSISIKKINKTAAKILNKNTEALKQIPNVEKFIK